MYIFTKPNKKCVLAYYWSSVHQGGSFKLGLLELNKNL